MKKQELLLIWIKFWLQINNVEKILLKKTALTKSQFFLSEDIIISEKELEDLKDLFRKVAFGYPIEYILEKAEFYWLDLYVDKRCLIPRNDTEIMVDKAIEIINKLSITDNNIIYIDVGTGSWAIPISVVDNVWQDIDKAFSVDISQNALEVAKKNIETHNLVDKIKLLKSDLLSEINFSTEGFSPLNYIITANLPYIKDEDFWNMDKDVILHEPSVALYWWAWTWFELYEKLIEQILIKSKGLKPSVDKIILFIEIWFDQKEVAINYLENKKLSFEIFKDNWWVDRCVRIEF